MLAASDDDHRRSARRLSSTVCSWSLGSLAITMSHHSIPVPRTLRGVPWSYQPCSWYVQSSLPNADSTASATIIRRLRGAVAFS